MMVKLMVELDLWWLMSIFQHGVHEPGGPWIQRLLGNRTGTAVAKGTFISSRFDHLAEAVSNPLKFNSRQPQYGPVTVPIRKVVQGLSPCQVVLVAVSGSPHLGCQNNSRRPTGRLNEISCARLSRSQLAF